MEIKKINPLNFFIQENISINPLTLLIGKRSKWISDQEISDYAKEVLAKEYPLTDKEKTIFLELAGLYSDNMERSLEKLTNINEKLKNETQEEIEKRKWRLYLLVQIDKDEKDIDNLLGETGRVYSIFESPIDMNYFVAFAFPEDEFNLCHTYEENQTRRFKNFKEFLEKEKKELSSL